MFLIWVVMCLIKFKIRYWLIPYTHTITTKRTISQLAETLTVVPANENIISVTMKARMIDPIILIFLVLDMENRDD